ncbi:amidohydrolase [Lentibacillus cibarius]|uniref:Amidohydrolase n=1 Tax=Lentibacillus cibarius TaxID=2583219 RepID=A0A5S3QMA4_9BACI|nr:amidohydrolase [Lentibacillus cibarius]TMN22919.1 amidohydrolase [Lentibacillus cibarius]
MTQERDIIFYNGRIFTADSDQPYVNTMIVRNGKVVWVGDNPDAERTDGRWVNLRQKRVLPGFIDAHMHPLHLAAVSEQIPCTPPKVHSIKDLQEQIKWQADRQENNDWIQGWGFDEGKLTEGRTPTRWDLDHAEAVIPVLLTRTCGHIAVANSKALEMAGIDKDTPNPSGGQIDRDEDGEPTGVVRETAKDLLDAVVPETTMEEDAELLASSSENLLAHGITGITDLMARKIPTDDADMYSLAQRKGLKQRAVLYYLWSEIKDNPNIGVERKDRREATHIGGIKVFSDGSVSGRTAWVSTPFLGNDDNYGISTTSEPELLTAADAAKKNGVQLVIHAMGEQAIAFIVDTLEHVNGWLDDAPSIRIEHASFPSGDILDRAAEAGIGIVTQPIFLYAEIESYLNNLGSGRTKSSYPIRTMLEKGMQVAISSDAPGNAWHDTVDPFVGLKGAVTRKAHDDTDVGQNQRINLETAIVLYTREAGKITRIPDVGQLTPGYHADFMILDRDILQTGPEELDNVRVLQTYMGGELVYEEETAGHKG